MLVTDTAVPPPTVDTLPYDGATEEKRFELQALITTMASRGLRTLAVSFREDFGKDDPCVVPITDLEKDMTLIALFGIKVTGHAFQ